MSLRQLRKLELQSAATERDEEDSGNNAKSSDESDDASAIRGAPAPRTSVFLQAVGSDFQVSEAESGGEQAAQPNVDHGTNVTSSAGNRSRGESAGSARQSTTRRRRRRHTKASSAGVPREDSIPRIDAAPETETDITHAPSVPPEAPKDPGDPSCLCMEKSAFDPEVDLRRLFGREVLRNSRIAGRGAAGSIRSRRHWLVASSENTPLVNPWVRMVASEDPQTKITEFSLQYTDEYVRMQPAFYAALHSNDPHVLMEFCRANRQHPDALLAFSQSLAVAGRHEAAFDALTEAVLSLQCSFHYLFSPFVQNPDGTPQVLTPRYTPAGKPHGLRQVLVSALMQVAVDSRNPLNRQLFACLVLYMWGLGEQGCHRCALEHLTYVVPLNTVEAAEMGENREAWRITDLRMAVPNFAYSAALASFMEATDPEIRSITRTKAEDICTIYGPNGEIRGDTGSGPAIQHRLLMHAIIIFPAFIRRLLEKLDIKGEQKVPDSLYPDIPWDTLLFALPLWSQGFPSHRKEASVHDHLVTCFVQKSHELWRAGLVIRWLHSCAAQLFKLCQDSTEQQLLMQYKISWASSEFLVDISRYTNARVSEFARHATLPSALMEMEDERARPSRGAGLRHHISLRSSPFVLFFQTLLPWNELDLTGLRAEPVYINHVLSTIWSSCMSALGAAVRALRALAASATGVARLVLPRWSFSDAGNDQPGIPGSPRSS